MKVYINKYRSHWLSPYTILEKVFFWREIEYDEPIIEKWSDRLEPMCRGLHKFLDVVHPKIDYVKIDKWDTWSMDHTLGKMVLPMLKQLKATKHGSPEVDIEDVPEFLRGTYTPDYSEQLTFEFYHETNDSEERPDDIIHRRWDWVMDEMIFAFEHLVDDSWEDSFRSGEIDILWEKSEKTYFNKVTNKEEATWEMKKGPNDTYQCDYEGMKKVYDRMDNGFRLFGKYYRGLWD